MLLLPLQWLPGGDHWWLVASRIGVVLIFAVAYRVWLDGAARIARTVFAGRLTPELDHAVSPRKSWDFSITTVCEKSRGEPSPEETAVPIGFLTDAERERLDSFPSQITRGDILTYFTLSRADRRQILRTASAANRLGFALQLGALRYQGFSPDDLSTAPAAVVAFVAQQLDVAPDEPWAAHLFIGYQGKYDVITMAGSMALRLPKERLPKPAGIPANSSAASSSSPDQPARGSR
jgi:hypothetical protein